MRDILEKKYKQSIYQKTIKKKVTLKGIGLHTGVKSEVTFRPAKENLGIRFKRVDIDGCPEILADIDHVIDISRGTSIGQEGFRIHTVEHILAAISGLQIDNILIELTEKEPPVMDGSAKPFVDVLEARANEVKEKLSEAENLRNEAQKSSAELIDQLYNFLYWDSGSKLVSIEKPISLYMKSMKLNKLVDWIDSLEGDHKLLFFNQLS